MNTYTIKTDKAYFAASERVLNTRSKAAKYALSVYSVFAGNFVGFIGET